MVLVGGNTKLFECGIILRSIILSLLVNLPSLYLYFQHGNRVLTAFSDWDEVFYLEQTLRVGNASWEDLINFESGAPKPFSPSRFVHPHYVSDVLIGKFFALFDFNPIEFGLILDLITLPLAYLAFYALFLGIASTRQKAETAAFVTLCIPYALVLAEYVHVSGIWFDSITTADYRMWPCIPVLRGVYTQASLPLFAIALTFGFEAHSRRRISIVAGFLSGLLMYLYFFAWASASCIIAMKFFLNIRYKRELYKSLEHFGLFALTNFIIISPAILLVWKTPATNALKLDPQLLSYWFLSIESALLLFLCLLLLLASKESQLKKVLLVCVSILLSEFVLMNSQRFLSFYIGAHHFTQFYLAPLFSGCVVLIVLSFVKTPIGKRVVNVSLASLFLFSVAHEIHIRQPEPWVDEVSQLIEYLEEHTKPEAMLGFYPFDELMGAQGLSGYALLPYWIKAFTKREIYFDIVNDFGPRLTPNEFALNFILRGEAGLLGYCPEKKPQGPGDILTGCLTYVAYQRDHVCERAETLDAQQEACEILRDARLDYLVLDRNVDPFDPEHLPKFTKALWISSSGRYEVRLVESDKVIQAICS